MNQDILIRNSEFNIGKVDNSTINTQNSTLRTAHRLPFLSILTHPKSLSTFMALLLSFSMTSKVMGRKWFAFKLMKTMYEILNKQVKFLTSQYVGTCKSAYIKGNALN